MYPQESLLWSYMEATATWCFTLLETVIDEPHEQCLIIMHREVQLYHDLIGHRNSRHCIDIGTTILSHFQNVVTICNRFFHF